MESDIVAQALEWWNMGITPVPLIWKSKRSLVKWRKLVDSLPPKPVIKLWFKGKQRNLGILLSNGLTVLDFDTTHHYVSWRTSLCPAAQSYTVKTARGWHVYVWLDDPPERTGHMVGGDVKATGYVVAPPSTHVTGRQYSVAIDGKILRFESLSKLGIDYRVGGEYEYNTRMPEGIYEGAGVVSRIKFTIGVVEYLSRVTEIYQVRGNIMARCPFHNDRNPSMLVVPDEGRTFCFNPACRAHKRMDVIDLCAMHREISNSEAIRLLAQELD